MIGINRPQGRLDDFSPTRLPFVFLCLTALLWICAFMSTRLFPNQPLGPEFPYLAAGSFTLIFAGLMGGFRLWTDWRDRNFRGYYQVFWQIKPNHLDSHFVNRKNLPNVVMRGWSLHVSLGGWFKRSFLSHDKGGRSVNFRITKVEWASFGGVVEVTVTDNSGDRLTLHPAELLRRLEATFPKGDRENPWNNGLAALLHDGERQQDVELRKVRGERDGLSELVGHTDEELGNIICMIEQGDRLKNTKEGKRLHGKLAEVRQQFATSMFKMQHDC